MALRQENKSVSSYDIEKIRRDFPIFSQLVNGKPLIYLDSAASAQKPKCMIDAVRSYYERDYANVHRGAYYLSGKATEAYENIRRQIAKFLGAQFEQEIVFTRNASESINLVAASYGKAFLHKDDEIILSTSEHHSNIIPWQIIAEEKGAHIKVIPLNEDGSINLDAYKKLLNPRTKIVGIGHITNSTGILCPLKTVIDLAHDQGAVVVVDGCQAVPHMKIDVQKLDCDFYVFTGHKLYGPTGTGILYGKKHLLDQMPPYQSGGSMIKNVTFAKTDYADVPTRFEAGTPNISGIMGLSAVVHYVQTIGLDAIGQHEKSLLDYALEQLPSIKNLKIIGSSPDKTSILSFIIDGIHPHDIATILDQDGIAVRAGHHCAQPTMDHYNIAGTIRISFGMYNTFQDIDFLVKSLTKVEGIFK
ncbi:MAG: cysteine desulfurase [Alphaproteobacteria bacterium]|nr:cysteine desulfurase [Alphaproteobacteria bacterium]